MSMFNMPPGFSTYGISEVADSRHSVKRLLAKLGVMSARDKELALSLADLQNALNASLTNFGAPDRVVVSPQAWYDINKMLKKP